MNSIKKGLSTLAVITISLALFACGDDDDAGGSPPTSPPTTAPALTLTPQAIKSFAFSWTDVADETEYRLLENPDGSSGYAPVATIPANATSHVLDVFLPGRINASYILQACNSAGCIDSAPAFVTGSLAEAVGYVKASNPDSNDRLGALSIALSADGTTLAVGSYREASNATGINGDETDNSAPESGAAYVFHRGSSSGTWSQQAYVKASNAEAGDQFGTFVALSADGNTLAVGAPNEASSATGINGDEADNSLAFAGAVYVFTRNAGVWSQQAYVKASNTGQDGFGWGLALSGDGNTLAAGAVGESSSATGINGDQSDNSSDGSGAAYVFVRDAGVWSQQAYVKASNTDANDSFGIAVTLSADGNTLAVASYFEDSAATGIDGDQADNSAIHSGAVYVYSRSGSAWTQQAYLKASNAQAGDQFGEIVALSADGNTLAVGAPQEDSNAIVINGDQADNSADGSGAAYVFIRDSGVWSQQAYVKAANTEAADGFGLSLALSGDGHTLAVGALGEDSVATGIDGDATDNSARDSGAVYVFKREADVWSQQTYVKSSNTQVGDGFGESVALAADGNTLAVAAPSEDSSATGIGGDQTDNSLLQSGAAYLY